MNDQSEQLDLILPAGMLAEIQSRAAKRGCTQEKLIDEVCQRTMARPPQQVSALLLRANAIDDALATGEPPPWPESFDECLEVGLILAGLTKSDSEDYLMETSGPKMDAIEEICRAQSISYEELVHRAIGAKLNDENDNDPQDW